MKIAILEDSFPPYHAGGAGVVAYNLARGLQQKGHEVLVITSVRKKEEEGVTVKDGMTLHTLASSYDLRFRAYMSLWNVPVVKKIETILTDFRPDVVHAHNVHLHLSYRSLAVAKRLGARVILTCHDVMSFNYQKLTEFIDPQDLSIPSSFTYRVSPWEQFKKNRFRYNPFRNLIIRFILRRYVDRIVAVSEALKQALLDNSISNVETIHNGIDVSEWEENADTIETFKKRYRIGAKAILFGGRLSAIKGAMQIVNALAAIHKKVSEVQLLVVGQKDAYTEKLLDYAQKLGIAENIILAGWLSGRELHAAYHTAALVVVPSICFDSFPTMNLEGMACHKPVVATCFGGSREIVRDGINGYIVNPYDSTVLSSRILTLLENEDRAKTFGEAGYAEVSKEFSLTRQLDHYERVYRAGRGKLD